MVLTCPGRCAARHLCSLTPVHASRVVEVPALRRQRENAAPRPTQDHFAAGYAAPSDPPDCRVRAASALRRRLRGDQESTLQQIAAASAAVTITTVFLIITLHHRALSPNNSECQDSNGLEKNSWFHPDRQSPCLTLIERREADDQAPDNAPIASESRDRWSALTSNRRSAAVKPAAPGARSMAQSSCAGEITRYSQAIRVISAIWA